MVIGRDEPAGSGRSQGRPRDGHHTGDQIGEGQQQAGRWQRQAAAAAGCHGGLSRFPVTLITPTLTGSWRMTAAFPDGLKMTETSS